MSASPYRFRTSCVPRALSACTGIGLDLVADVLWRTGCARPMATGGPLIGADVRSSIDAVMFRFGVRAALTYAGTTLTPSATAAYLAAWRHGQVRTVRRRRAAEHAPGGAQSSGTTNGRRVRDWSPSGAWLLCVTVPGEGGHALAWVEGEIVAGGERYGDLYVEQGWQMFTKEMRL